MMANSFSSRGSAGVALLAVLWALALISLAVLSLGLLLDVTMSQQTSLLATTRALLAAESGLEMVKNPAVNASNCGEAVRKLNEILYPRKQGGSSGEGISFSVTLSREGALLDLNRLATNQVLCQEVLGQLFKMQWEVNPRIADRAIDGLIDWVDPDNETQLSGAESRQYERARRPGPRNGPMVGREEFLMISGWPELQEAVRRVGKDLRNYFTVSGAEKLDLLTAQGDLIEAVLKLPPDGSRRWLAERYGPDGLPLTPDDIQDPGQAAARLGVGLELLNERATFQGRLRVLSTGKVGETTRTIEAVLSDGAPRKIEARWLQ